MIAALSKFGLEMKPSKVCGVETTRPTNSDPVITSIRVDTGLVVLRSPAVDGSETPLGAPALDATKPESGPTTERADKDCKLATEITDMARAVVDECGEPTATVLLQRVACPFDNDFSGNNIRRMKTDWIFLCSAF